MEINAKNIIPIRATHPGSILKSELQARGIKQKDFAEIIGMPTSNLNEIIKGKRNISDATAIKLENALGIPFQTWINLQSRYNYVVKRQNMSCQSDKSAVSGNNICSFNIRMSPEIHDNVALLAKKTGISMNAFIKKAIEQQIASLL